MSGAVEDCRHVVFSDFNFIIPDEDFLATRQLQRSLIIMPQALYDIIRLPFDHRKLALQFEKITRVSSSFNAITEIKDNDNNPFINGSNNPPGTSSY